MIWQNGPSGISLGGKHMLCMNWGGGQGGGQGGGHCDFQDYLYC